LKFQLNQLKEKVFHFKGRKIHKNKLLGIFILKIIILNKFIVNEEGIMKIDFKDIYRGRIQEIDKQIKKAVYEKKWTLKAKLEAEKVELLERIKKLS